MNTLKTRVTTNKWSGTFCGWWRGYLICQCSTKELAKKTVNEYAEKQEAIILAKQALMVKAI